MLIRFNVKNFLSFHQMENGRSVEFSMIAGKGSRKNERLFCDNNLRLLKLATVYGANASGKSNLVRAIDFARNTIVYGLPKGHMNMYCKVIDGNDKLPSYFEFEIQNKDKYYAYGFEVVLSESRFVSEWLVELIPNGNDKVLFERNIEEGTYSFDGLHCNDSTKTRLKYYADDIKEINSVLFLKVMNEHKQGFYENIDNDSVLALKNVYEWIYNDLDVNYPARPITTYEYISKCDDVDSIRKMIGSFGTGIKGFKMVEVSKEYVKDLLPSNLFDDLVVKMEVNKAALNRSENGLSEITMRLRSDNMFLIVTQNKETEKLETIKFIHENENVLFDLQEESDGTIRILDLLDILLSDNGKTYVIDELDRCLHPNLTYRFIELYLELVRKKDVQLVVTTHESRLLDFDLLRRDEVWFVDKRSNGSSELYSLDEYNERYDKKIDTAYLDGRYGGVPVFNTLFPVSKCDGEGIH